MKKNYKEPKIKPVKLKAEGIMAGSGPYTTIESNSTPGGIANFRYRSGSATENLGDDIVDE